MSKFIADHNFNNSQLEICNTFCIRNKEYTKLQISKTGSDYYLTKDNDTDNKKKITLDELQNMIEGISIKTNCPNLIDRMKQLTNDINSAIKIEQKPSLENSAEVSSGNKEEPETTVTGVSGKSLKGYLRDRVNFADKITCGAFSRGSR